ncbi:unnamed protein product, partial [Ranitomeya imitator]
FVFNSLYSGLHISGLSVVYNICLFIIPHGNLTSLLMYLLFGFFLFPYEDENHLYLYLMMVLLAGFFGSGALLLAYSSARAAVAEAPFSFRSRRNCWRSSGQFHKNCAVTNSSWTSWRAVSARPEVQCSAVLSNARMWSVQVSFGPRCRLQNFLRKHKFKENPEDLEEVDEEVLAERERVKYLKGATDAEEKPTIIIDSLRKEFKDKSGTFTCRKRRKKAAARHLSFCVKKGEVLGLLGPNGAGKTTSVLVLAGELTPTAGEVVLGSAADDSAAFMGYCPQFSPLWPTLTVKEHLEVYATVKGMKKNDANEAVKRVSDALELRKHLNMPAKKLSAGVSRKVCFAISMLGNPTIALLDEPSTGLDPKGQQRLWREPSEQLSGTRTEAPS